MNINENNIILITITSLNIIITLLTRFIKNIDKDKLRKYKIIKCYKKLKEFGIDLSFLPDLKEQYEIVNSKKKS